MELTGMSRPSLARQRCSAAESRRCIPLCTEVRARSGCARPRADRSTGILARETQSDLADLAAQQINLISLVVCNLYPFSETISRSPAPSIAQAVEEVDIGGVTLLRAGAKNHERCVRAAPHRQQLIRGSG
jgi:hypothetical protein